MLVHFPQCFLNAFYIVSLCCWNTSKARCCSLVCGRLPVFQCSGQCEWRQWACPPGGAQPLQLPVLLFLRRILPAQVGRAFLFFVVALPCCSTGLGFLLWSSETPCSSERQGNQALSALVKNFESKLFCFSYPSVRAPSRKEPLG